MIDTPVCECGNRAFELEERQNLIPKQEVPASEYWDSHVWEDYQIAYMTHQYAVCTLCKKAYRI